MATLLAQVSDDAALGRYLRVSIRHWLIDRARKSRLGSLRRTLEDVLSKDDRIEKVPAHEPGAGRWRMVGTSDPPWSGRTDDLVVAARMVRSVRIPKWSGESRAPVADRASLGSVAVAVLSAASGSLEIGQLTVVFARRFPVVLDPIEMSLTDESVGELTADVLSPEEQLIAAEDEADAAATALSIVGMLSPLQRLLVPHLENAEEVRRLVGCGRSQAYHQMRCLKERLAELVGEGDDVRAVGLEVIRLCGVIEVK
ncbi:hypothetical protein [Fodinicola feengrottensis]|uniref:hypothetical protein n=1 Tax=Fodinicola feengrottensis TaxID=435914 RepID=UPI0013D8C035|nr:hypothetical protein [Fodinicola feengrottensis]